MGSDSPCCSDNENGTQNQNKYSSYSKFDPVIINKKFEEFIYNDKIIDLIGNKYNMNDPVFKSLHKEESEILTKFYREKKIEFKNKVDEYLKVQNLNFFNLLTKEIISNEGV